VLGYSNLFQRAASQLGYFTIEQAHEFGISSRMVLHHASTGRFVRAARGVYRFRDYPDSPSDIPLAWLIVSRLADGVAVVSHESALYVHELADVLPRAIDVTVDRAQRGIKVPSHPPIRLHTTNTGYVDAEDLESRAGAVVTSPIRSLVDCLMARTEGQQLIRAVQEARDRGWLTDRLLLAHAERRGLSALARTRALLAEADPGTSAA
jgi:predicted transcriptional regulator of viral defense system